MLTYTEDSSATNTHNKEVTMKKAELERKLAKLGAYPLRHGSGHDVWASRKGARLYIPRHKEVDELVAKSIIKLAEN